MDDQVETILMRLSNGHRGLGLTGIKPIAKIPECFGIHGVYESGEHEHLQISTAGDQAQNQHPMESYKADLILSDKRQRRALHREVIENVSAVARTKQSVGTTIPSNDDAVRNAIKLRREEMISAEEENESSFAVPDNSIENIDNNLLLRTPLGIVRSCQIQRWSGNVIVEAPRAEGRITTQGLSQSDDYCPPNGSSKPRFDRHFDPSVIKYCVEQLRSFIAGTKTM